MGGGDGGEGWGWEVRGGDGGWGMGGEGGWGMGDGRWGGR